MLDCPPKLELSVMQLDGRDSHSLTASITGIEMDTHDNFDQSSFGMQNDTTPSQHSPDSMRIPTELAKWTSMKSDPCRKHMRRNTTVYKDHIHRSTGLPVNRRITGMSYGSDSYSPSRSNTSFSRSSTRCTSTFSAVPLAFAQSPVVRQRVAEVTMPTEERHSMRIVRS
jgi:hypothetical protein